MELKDLRFNLKIRVYGEGYKTHLSHAFLVDDMPMGVSAPVGELVIDVRNVTLQQLRPMIMYDIRGAMKRRSMLWQEVLFIFGRLPNMYDRPKSELNKYQFGFVRKSKLEDIKLIHPSRETVPIADLIGATDFFSHDLVIVPVTQLHPDIENAPAPPMQTSEPPPPAPTPVLPTESTENGTEVTPVAAPALNVPLPLSSAASIGNGSAAVNSAKKSQVSSKRGSKR